MLGHQPAVCGPNSRALTLSQCIQPSQFLASWQSRINLFCHYTAFAWELTHPHLFHASAHNMWHHRQLLTSQGHLSVPHFQSNHTVNLISPPLCLEEVGGRRCIQPTLHLLGHKEFLKVFFWKNRAHSLTCCLLCNEWWVSSISIFPLRKEAHFSLYPLQKVMARDDLFFSFPLCLCSPMFVRKVWQTGLWSAVSDSWVCPSPPQSLSNQSHSWHRAVPAAAAWPASHRNTLIKRD